MLVVAKQKVDSIITFNKCYIQGMLNPSSGLDQARGLLISGFFDAKPAEQADAFKQVQTRLTVTIQSHDWIYKHNDIKRIHHYLTSSLHGGPNF